VNTRPRAICSSSWICCVSSAKSLSACSAFR
jgi:hypothetical protein